MARLLPVGRHEERIVGRNRAVLVDAQHLSQHVPHRLRIRAVGVLTDGDVELPIGAEVQRAAVVVRGAAQVVEVEDHDLAAGDGDVAIGGEPADAVVHGGRRRRVVDVDEPVGGKCRIEGDSKQTALADCIMVERSTNGVARSTPFLITRSRPPCSQTNKRPSGANCIAVGFDNALATCLSVKPVGSMAAMP